jgi:hypothetical protein
VNLKKKAMCMQEECATLRLNPYELLCWNMVAALEFLASHRGFREPLLMHS